MNTTQFYGSSVVAWTVFTAAVLCIKLKWDKICILLLLLFNIISKAADHLLRIISSMESKYLENNNNNNNK